MTAVFPLAAGCSPWAALVASEGSGPEANSLYECVAHQIYASLTERTRIPPPQTHPLFSRPLTLNGLVRLAQLERLSSDFQWKEGVGSDLGRLQRWRVDPDVHRIVCLFLKTVEALKASRQVRSISESPAYLLGEDFLLEVLEEALASDQKDRVRRAIVAADRSPMPLLWMHRLVHVLMSRDYEFKMEELLDFPPDRNILPSGSTAFVPSLYLKEVYGRIAREPARTDEGLRKERAKAWRKAVHEIGGDGERLVTLLKINGTKTSLAAAEAVSRKQIQILSLRRNVFQNMASARLDGLIPEKLRIARTFYLMPEENGGRPAIVIEDPQEIAQPGDASFASVMGEVCWAVTHEMRHLLQIAAERDPYYPERHQIPAEAEALADQIHLALRNGDDALYRTVSGYSPFGFEMGLRNWIEFAYHRV